MLCLVLDLRAPSQLEHAAHLAGRGREQIELTVKGAAERAISMNSPVVAVKEDLQSTSWPTNGTLLDRRTGQTAEDLRGCRWRGNKSAPELADVMAQEKDFWILGSLQEAKSGEGRQGMVVADDSPGGRTTQAVHGGARRSNALGAEKEEGPHSSLNNLCLSREALRIRAEL